MDVTLIDKMGSDLTVVNSARVSFNKESDWEKDTKNSVHCETCDCHQEYAKGFGYCYPKLSEKDQKLISYLAKHNHFTPFTHVQITLRLKMPIFVARQFTKHQVGFTTNEVSRRYVDEPPEFYTPDVWRKRAENKKQGSSDEVLGMVEEADANAEYANFIEMCQFTYKYLLDMKIAPEMARMILPQSMYTEMYTTASLVGWARMYKLRTDGHAQSEITDLAKMVGDIISGIPELEHSWKALTG